MASSTRETPIKDRCMRYLNKLQHGKFIKIHGTVFARTGTPDILGCYKGQMFLFEVKRPPNVPTDRQVEEMVQWQRAGAIVYAVYSAEDCREILEPWLTLADKEIAP